jgi:phosphate transport system permease protein
MAAVVTPIRRLRPRAFRASDLVVAAASGASSLALVWLVYYRLAPFSGIQGFLLLWFSAFLTMYWLAERELVGSLVAKDRVVAALVTGISLAIIVPLASILVYTTVAGARYLTFGFFTHTLATTGPEDPATAGGGLQAIIGTATQVGIALLISVPLGILTAVFLNEVGGRLRRPVRIFVDAMSGVPSIVAGLFIYIVLVDKLNWGFSGLAAGLALSILMLPTVTRTAEVVLRLVPGGLREASLALGAPEWRTAWSVVLPTARVGLVTAVILGIARVVGETAPLIMTSFGNSSMNFNPLHGAQDALPLRAFELIKQNSVANQEHRAWLYAFVLIVLVLIVFVIGRIVGGMSIGGGRRRFARRSADAAVIAAGVPADLAVPDPTTDRTET